MAKTVYQIIAGIRSEGIERRLPYIFTDEALAWKVCDALSNLMPNTSHRTEEGQTSVTLSKAVVTFGKGAIHAYHGGK